MKYERLSNPTFNNNDIVRIVPYNKYVVEVTQIHYDIEPEPYNPENQKKFKPKKYKTQYGLSKELKAAREKIFTNITPDEINYTFFITLTREGCNSLNNAKRAFKHFKEDFEETFGDFKFFAFYEKSDSDNYHIHTLIWDPLHSKQFEFIKFDEIKKLWYGECVVKKPRDFDALISFAYYVTKKEKHKGKIPSNDILWECSEGILDTPKSRKFDKCDVEGMSELCSNSYRLYDDKNKFDVTIKRTMFVLEM